MDGVYVLVAGVVIVEGTVIRDVGVLTTDGTVTFVAGVTVTVDGERYRVLIKRDGDIYCVVEEDTVGE
ncbi:MAG: hypothetical protein D3909_03625 [Candidatus Electrothrix sp. ATG1]|nr:hypothetical protein [Candidatus Electrothrix sp. ATG1]